MTVVVGCPVLEPDANGLFFAMMIGDFAAARQCPSVIPGTAGTEGVTRLSAARVSGMLPVRAELGMRDLVVCVIVGR